MSDNMFVNVIAASRHPDKDVYPIITIHAHYPRFIHAEVMTHRVFSRNARSSRAVPIQKMIDEVEINPVIPWHWGKNQPGMQAFEECNEHVVYQDFNEYERTTKREIAWGEAASNAVRIAKGFMRAGYHKQVVNRLLEPFMWIDTLITSTEWDNFFELRIHKDAEPHIRDLAILIKEAIQNAEYHELNENEWHLPYISEEEGDEYDIETLLKISAARCARISYKPFKESNGDDDIKLFDKLISSKPMHASPVEHQAKAISTTIYFTDYLDEPLPLGEGGNFCDGWHQWRKMLEDGNIL